MSRTKPATLTGRAGSMVYTGWTSGNKSDDKPVEPPISMTPPTIVRHPEFFFNDTLVAIQIENTLFNVHKYQLVKSEVFSDMFKMPKPQGDEPEEGSSPEHPITIEGVAASDFAALLKVLYASLFSSNQPAVEAPLVIPAFRLANMFNFSELRAHLLPLAGKNLGDVDKILFAREFDLKEWLVPAYTRLCQREERLSIEEAVKLEVRSVLLISHMREQYRSLGSAITPNFYYCNACSGMQYYNTKASCNHCNSNTANLYCNGPGTMGSMTSIDSDAIEAEVKEWVEDNCATGK
ncbi:BTB/POZ domain protein [Rhizoctonia solani AG-3 Rhs1AP]|uniref:BTB/POZ domain protein n=2 Tax=Rhizoctonia solani AG-3 TaxID=1086053 RepID=A0A074RNM4_9AGAM|nr:BTB/POZ domain protein [Rhizoctonia solani AG-3 Rhs1AP]KEP48474.1 BTB/POZ domain protein [Rhizoctonia solani 123E]